uniref:Uncharacterized protein n=1 Tax=Parasteatoda tepidariorum TaxID=114398 RepID=A0A2L2YHA4_PARTP|nr:uncharacterized protein LOC107457134 [Parasteatoda tepidariorum]
MLILAIFIVLLPATYAHKTNCYVCSFSPKDATNRTSLCKDEEIAPNLVSTSECDYGCQTYTQIDSNGVFEHVRRNCAQPDSGIDYGTCKTEESNIYKSVRCVCNTYLCNAASTLTHAIILYTFILLIFHCF